MKRLLPVILLLFATSCLPSGDYTAIDAEEFQKMIGAAKTNLVIADTRTDYEYRAGHIPGSVNLTPDKFSNIQAYLPNDKDIPVVFYCRGYG